MDFELRGIGYKTNTLDPFVQLALVQRLAKTVKDVLTGEVVGVLAKMMEEKEKKLDDPSYVKLIVPLVTAIGRLPDEDSQFVIKTCLNACQRQIEGKGWQKVSVNGMLMFNDMTLVDMLKITYEVLAENLGPFFSELPSLFPEAASEE